MIRTLPFVLVSLSLFILITTQSILSVALSPTFYQRARQKYNYPSRISATQSAVMTSNILEFLMQKKPVSPAFFTREEISHLEDVKIIVQKVKRLRNISLAATLLIVLITISRQRELAKTFFSTGIFLVGFPLLMILVYIVTGFDYLFIKFHQLFFTGNYAFDPAVSNLKALFPDAIFFQLAKDIVIRTILAGTGVMLIGLFLRKKGSVVNLASHSH